MADDVIASLIEKGDVMWCCGGFMIDDPLVAPFLGDRTGVSTVGLECSSVDCEETDDWGVARLDSRAPTGG